MSKRNKLFATIVAVLSLAISLLSGGCSRTMPKPRGYFRIELPEHQYQGIENQAYPFDFEYNSVARVEPHASGADSFWVDVVYDRLNAKIYCSYKVVNGNLREISEDSRNFVYKHTSKADDITEQAYINEEQGVYSLLYELKGNTASPIQFVITDSVRNFFRGALYFNNTPNQDSLRPVTEFMKEDIVHLIETLQWTDKRGSVK